MDKLTLYEVSHKRNKATLEQLPGPSFDGILLSDCLSIYEHFCQTQQKCYAHHLKAISTAPWPLVPKAVS